MGICIVQEKKQRNLLDLFFSLTLMLTKDRIRGVALYRALEFNVTNIFRYNQTGFEILKERMGEIPKLELENISIVKNIKSDRSVSSKRSKYSIYSVGDDGRVLINKDTGEPIAVTRLDANSDIVPLAVVLARLKKMLKK